MTIVVDAGRARGVQMSDMTTDGQLSGLTRARVALEALCSERSVQRYLAGATVSESTRLRIEAALVKLRLKGAVRARAAS